MFSNIDGMEKAHAKCIDFRVTELYYDETVFLISIVFLKKDQ